MRVLSYNICGSRAARRPGHIEQVAAVIRDLRPDIAGLQEVFQGDAGNPLGDQPAQLAALTGLTPVFWPHVYLRGSAFGNAVLARGPTRHAEMYRLPSRLPQLRALLEAQVEIEGRRVEFFCTHLVHFGPLMAGPRARQLGAVIGHLAARRLPRVLVGDFNSHWRSLDMAALAGIGLFPAREQEEPTFPARQPRFCLDHIFISREWRCRAVYAVPCTVSDHRPLLAELELAGG